MSIKRLILSIFIIMAIFCLSLTYLILELKNNQEKLQQSNKNRYQSYLLADELRQSSDDLTHFMRSYVISGDERFKQQYFEVLAIRNGESPRPLQYNQIYWDLRIGNNTNPRAVGANQSLNSLMLDNGFSESELAQLNTSHANSDALVNTELTAMNMLNGLYKGEDNKFTRRGEPNKKLAYELMFNEAYYKEKAKVMLPVARFFSMLDKRTKQEVDFYLDQDHKVFNRLIILTVSIVLFTFLLCSALIKFVLKPLGGEPEKMNLVAHSITEGNLDISFDKKPSGVYKSLKEMTENLKYHHTENTNRAWFQEGRASIDDILRTERKQSKISAQVLTMLARYLNAEVGAIYVWKNNVLDNGEGVLNKSAVFAQVDDTLHNKHYRLHEGLIGQAAAEGELIVTQDFPKDYLTIHSATGQHDVVQLVFVPFSYMGGLRGIIELAFLNPVSKLKLEFLDSLRESLGIAFENISAHSDLNKALEEAQNLSEELQTQQEELRVSNESLRAKSQDLEQQKIVLLESKVEIEAKATQLEQSNLYKSEFLANMSHELRTPLNSLLILAKSLSVNQTGNLSDDEVYSAKVIHDSGNHLLDLINHILDLSKTEAGHMQVYDDKIDLTLLQKQLRDRFSVLASEKKIEFSFTLDPIIPKYINTDKVRLEQILTNLISNAIKFTEQGSVTVNVSIHPAGQLMFTVTDTGIGIPSEMLEHIFGAFQQVDGSMTRKYGGTGLGLSISRELAHLLAGDISVESTLNTGSVFTLILPLHGEISYPLDSNATEEILPSKAVIAKSTMGNKQVLIIENSEVHAVILRPLLKFDNVTVTFVSTGEEALRLMSETYYFAVILDMNLPVLSGFEVLERSKEIKDKQRPEFIIYNSHDLDDNELLKINQYTDKIIIKSKFSAERLFDELQELINNDSVSQAIAKELLPIEQNTEMKKLERKTVLLVDDDMRNTYSLAKVLRADGLNVDIATSGMQALEALEQSIDIDIVIMDMMMPVMDGYQTTMKIREQDKFKKLPIIAFTAAALSEDKEKCLNAGTTDYLTKPVDLQLLYKSLLACI